MLYLLSEKGMTRRRLQDLLYHECGLKGLSGISNDVRDLLASDDPRAAFAIDYFVYRVRSARGHAGGRAGRARCLRLHRRDRRELGADPRADRREARWLGAELDPAANDGRQPLISTAGQPRRRSMSSRPTKN